MVTLFNQLHFFFGERNEAVCFLGGPNLLKQLAAFDHVTRVTTSSSSSFHPIHVRGSNGSKGATIREREGGKLQWSEGRKKGGPGVVHWLLLHRLTTKVCVLYAPFTQFLFCFLALRLSFLISKNWETFRSVSQTSRFSSPTLATSRCLFSLTHRRAPCFLLWGKKTEEPSSVRVNVSENSNHKHVICRVEEFIEPRLASSGYILQPRLTWRAHAGPTDAHPQRQASSVWFL